jgi:hypothetical protein
MAPIPFSLAVRTEKMLCRVGLAAPFALGLPWW